VKKVIKKIARKTAPRLVDTMRTIDGLQRRLDDMQGQLNTVSDGVGRIEHFDSRIEQLKRIAGHIEPYQPAYGLPGVVDAPHRDSSERCRTIESYLQPVAGKRILDLGASLGFFSYYFADRGASVEAWESHPKNAEVARKIGELNGIAVDVKTKEFNAETVLTVPYGTFDAAFVLSVFHHIIRYNGLEYTQHLVKELLDRVPIMIVELAKKGEDPDLPWDASQPDDELAIFDIVKDDVTIKKLGDFKNHLSDKTRPLYAIQKKKHVTVNTHVYQYQSVSSQAYKDSPVPFANVHRRYYYGNNFIVKDYAFDAKSKGENLSQILNEVKVLNDLKTLKATVYHAPVLLDFEIDYPQSAKVAIEKVEGTLALELGAPLSAAHVSKVVKDVLRTLSDLEALGLHHNDVRSWNIIIDSNGSAWLIDYGLASARSTDQDVVALLWTAVALFKGERESYMPNKQQLPSAKEFAGLELLTSLYDAIKKGERSPSALLKLVK
jgi:tRNA A-37 threonylcarbamoyl transferase component Bud32/2-polyprenyl-3-methyl-5-hydroxy-6-metoxy-1,4-benzoquinol methylase